MKPPIQIDVTDFEAVQHLRKQIEADLGPVDILISNAGLMPLLSLREGNEKEIQRIVDVNITANYYVWFAMKASAIDFQQLKIPFPWT